ncbi:hypothetical protein V5O48_016556, partial [Marasmius crinis-equi]
MSTNGYAYTSLSTNDSHEPAPITPSRLRTLTHTIYTPIKQFFRTNYGLLLVIASQGCLAMVNVAVKKLNSIDPPVPILELILIRMVSPSKSLLLSIQTLFTSWLTGHHLALQHRPHVRLVLTFCLCPSSLLDYISGTTTTSNTPLSVQKAYAYFFSLEVLAGIFGVYSALQWISLSDATVLTFLAPLTTAMAGSIFLKEKFVKSQAIAGVLSLLGVILIARPVALFGHIPETVDEVVGIELDEPVPPLKLEGADTPDRRLLAVGMIITRTAFIFPTKPLWGLLLLEIGVLGFTAQVLLTMGLQHEQAGRATMAIYTQLTKEKMPEEEEGQKELNLQGVVVALERLDRVDEAVGLEEGLLGVGGGVDEGLEKEGKRE